MRSFHVNTFASVVRLLGIIHFAACGAVFIEPYDKIIQFRANVVVPKAPTAIQATGIQSFWPALEPANSAAILQNVIANEGTLLGQWSFFEYFLDIMGDKGVIHGEDSDVYPGDIIENNFVKMDYSHLWSGPANSRQWFVYWVVTRGAEGLAKGEVDFSGNFTIDLTAYPEVGDFTQAIVATELNRAAKWEMGPVVWNKILVQISGTSIEWCRLDKLVLSGVTLSDVGPVTSYLSMTGALCLIAGFTMTNTKATT
ncbi:hypothetical protein EAF04_009884 [Stromatinia cepivora]|nr:hypothetical protein EAF04_009884 [Stromatinia cepivora]